MDIARHIRVFEKMPGDEYVEKRTIMIAALAKKYGAYKTVSDLLQLASDLVSAAAKGGALPEGRATEIENIIREQSASFVRNGQELQMLSIALMAALQCLEGASPSSGIWNVRDVLAIGLWSGLGFQLPRTEEGLENLRTEVLSIARTLVLASASKARVRQEVANTAPKLPEAYDQVKTASAIQNSAKQAIDALRSNAAMDREEIDFLWWVQGGWSKFADAPFVSLSPAAAIICGGLEAGSLLRRVPGQAHKHLVLRLLETDEIISFKALLEAVGTQREAFVTAFSSNDLLSGRESLFPLTAALLSGKPSGLGASSRGLKLSEWGERALLESSILHVGKLPNDLV